MQAGVQVKQRLAFFKSNVLPLILGQLGVAALQGCQLLIVARALGPGEFGKVATILAITAALLPFSGLGTANLMVMQLARGATDAHRLYGNSLMTGLLSGAVLTVLTVVGFNAWGSPDLTLSSCLLFCISELIFTKWVDISQHVFFGLDRHATASKLLLVQSTLRLAAAIFIFHLDLNTVQDWAVAHACGGALAAVFSIVYTQRSTQGMRIDLNKIKTDIQSGVFFSMGFAARSVYIDIDKAIIPRFEPMSINGAYTAAFRLVYMATTPLSAGLLALQAKMYRAGGTHGITETARIARRAMLLGGIYGACVGILIYAGAPILPMVIGDKYSLSVDIMRTLAFLPIPLFMQSALSDALAAANHQRARSLIQVMVAVVALVLNWVLIQRYSWQGAAISAYVCQVLLLLSMGALVHQKTK